MVLDSGLCERRGGAGHTSGLGQVAKPGSYGRGRLAELGVGTAGGRFNLVRSSTFLDLYLFVRLTSWWRGLHVPFDLLLCALLHCLPCAARARAQADRSARSEEHT